MGIRGASRCTQIVALDPDIEPAPDKLRQWSRLGVCETLYGFPEGTDAEVETYVRGLADKLAAIGPFASNTAAYI